MQGNIWIDFSQTLTPSLDRLLIPVTSRRRVTPCRGYLDRLLTDSDSVAGPIVDPRDIKEGHTVQGDIWIDCSQTLTPSLDRSLIPVTSRRRVSDSCRGISG